MFSFPKPDERTRQLRERAGSAASSIMIGLALLIACFSMFSYGDYKTAGILMGWFILGSIYSMSFDSKISSVAREELTRDTKQRKLSFLYFYLTIPLWLGLWFCFSYFLPAEHPKTLKGSLLYTIGMTAWLSLFMWWKYLRKFKDK